jgi:hypothetical protein
VDTAFYALSGGYIVDTEHNTRTLDHIAFSDLSIFDRESLLLLQQAMLQDPSKASGLAKSITCTQAFRSAANVSHA